MSRLKLMKGETWQDALKPTPKFPEGRVQFPVLVEPKVDEIRVQVLVHQGEGRVEYLSYAGKPLHNFPGEWADAFLAAANWFGLTEWDCGLEVNRNFNDSYRWVRSSKGVPEDLEDAKLVLHVYDLPGASGDYTDRLDLVREAIDFMVCEGYNVPFQRPEGIVAHTVQQVEDLYLSYVKCGYEGAMVKSMGYQYQRKRSWDWLKLKPGAEADGEVLLMHQAFSAEGEPLGRVGSFVVRMEDGSIAEPGAGALTHLEAKDLWENYEAFMATKPWIVFKYMERDRQGGYRHPRFFRHRESK